MDNFSFFDLIFEQHNPKVSKSYIAGQKEEHNKVIDPNQTIVEEFTRFFKRHNLDPLFTNEHRFEPIIVRLPDAESVLKNGGKANRILTEFSNLLSWGQDNKNFERAISKILHESKNWNQFIKNVDEHNIYVTYIVEQAHLHNAWNIVWYDKDKTGYAQGKAARAN